ncbi:MAG TPA: type II secretion system F family protein [Marmoricola sp.]|nr:type II secretion system F family protein [Marmoricola sp.]
MTAPALLAGVAAGLSAALLLAGPRPARLPESHPDAPSTRGRRHSGKRSGEVPDRGLLLTLRPAVALGSFLAGWLVVGGSVGPVAGVVLAGLTWRALGDAEGPAARRRRERLARDLPLGVELLGACVRSGAPVESSLGTVAAAVGGPLGETLRGVEHRLALGLDPLTVWRQLAAQPTLAPLGRAVARSHESGASVVEAIEALSADLREQSRTEAQVRANAVEVRAAAPLGVCFLPAFLLIGVVPLIAGVVSGMALFR